MGTPKNTNGSVGKLSFDVFCANMRDAGYELSLTTLAAQKKFASIRVDIMSPDANHVTDIILTTNPKVEGFTVTRSQVFYTLGNLGAYGQPVNGLGSGS